MRSATSPSTDFPAGYDETERPPALYAIALLLGLVALGGIVGGASMISDPTGRILGAETRWLEGTPVSDFVLPGVFLLAFYGVFGAMAIVGLLTRWSPGWLHAIDRRTGHVWSWWSSITIGLVLVGWIVYELFVMPDRIWLQPALAATGLAIIALCMVPSVRAYARSR